VSIFCVFLLLLASISQFASAISSRGKYSSFYGKNTIDVGLETVVTTWGPDVGWILATIAMGLSLLALICVCYYSRGGINGYTSL